MTHNRLFSAIAFSLLVLCTLSCKKKDKDEITYSRFNGIPRFNLPTYVQPGDAFNLQPAKVRRAYDDDCKDGIGYSWIVSPIMTKRDTVRKEKDAESASADFSFTVPDTLCTITTTCSAFATGYTNASYEVSSVIIRPSGKDKSLQGITYPDESKVITDARDSRKYHYTTVAGRDWFIDNLSYEGAGRPFFDSPAMTDVFGMFYSWNEAVNACPEGWRLPSNADFLALHNSLTGASSTDAATTFYGKMGSCMVDAYLNEAKLWEFWPGVDISNSTGLAMLPTGYATIDKDNMARFYGSRYYFACWTADEADSGKAYYRYIYADKPDMLLGSGDKSGFATAIRCVRNSE